MIALDLLVPRSKNPLHEQFEAWLSNRLPAVLLRPGPYHLFWWQWLAVPILVIVAWSLGYLLSRLSRALLARLARHTETVWDDAVMARIGPPLTLAWALLVTYGLLPWLALEQTAESFFHRLLSGGFFATFFWAIARSIDVVGEMVAQSSWALQRPGSRSLIPLATRVGKIIVVAIAVVALLSQLGYPVASLVAGLGIGGLAVALAAQKTVENLFGAFTIGADQPFSQGDFVKIEDTLGTVEAIGLRSTRIRSLDRTLVTIPNGKLAEMRLESYTARDRMRLFCPIGLVYGTTAAQMRQVLTGIERVLSEHPKIWPDVVVVRFKEFGESALDIEVMAWFKTSDWNEFIAIREEVLLRFMEVVEQAKTSFAFPTRTIHVVSDQSLAERH